MNEQEYPPNTGQEDQPADELVDLSDEDIADVEETGEAPDSAEISELNDRILRLAAELENTRRRAVREKADAGRYAIANFARDLLGVTDNFERALQAAGDENAEPSRETLSSLIAGLRMTEKELLAVLERYGVQRVFPTGEKFDPNLHQAVAQVPGGSIPVGHVVDVAQPGFTISDRVLRAAMVTISSGVSETTDDVGAHVDTKV